MIKDTLINIWDGVFSRLTKNVQTKRGTTKQKKHFTFQILSSRCMIAGFSIKKLNMNVLTEKSFDGMESEGECTV